MRLCISQDQVLPRGFSLLNELFQTELLHSVAHLSQSYAQFLGRMRLNPIVSLQSVKHLLSFPFTERTQQLSDLASPVL